MFVVGNGYRLLVLLAALRGGGCGSVLVVRLVMVPDILLGPEETSIVPGWGVGLFVLVQSDPGHQTIVPAWFGMVCGGGGGCGLAVV